VLLIEVGEMENQLVKILQKLRVKQDFRKVKCFATAFFITLALPVIVLRCIDVLLLLLVFV
jgi:hypothetical protein